MTWLQRHRVNTFIRHSVWLPPLLGMVAALLINRLVRWVDDWLGWTATMVGPEGARAVLSTLASSMMTFIVFVFSILLVAVQLASAQLSPRIISTIYQDRVFKFSLSVFVFAFTFTMAVLSRIEDSVPKLSMWLAAYSSVAYIAIFLYMIDHVGKSLRPVSILTRIGRLGQKVIESVYPHRLEVSTVADAPTNVALPPVDAPSRTVASTHSGVVLAFDPAGLMDLARGDDCLIEFVPQVGDFVAYGDPLFRVYGGGAGVADRELWQSVAIGPERTMEQDPEFAFRVIVDIAAKALSPLTTQPPPSLPSTNCTICCIRSPRANWIRVASMTRQGNCVWLIGRRIGITSFASRI